MSFELLAGKKYMSHAPPSSRSPDDKEAGSLPSIEQPAMDHKVHTEKKHRGQQTEKQHRGEQTEKEHREEQTEKQHREEQTEKQHREEKTEKQHRGEQTEKDVVKKKEVKEEDSSESKEESEDLSENVNNSEEVMSEVLIAGDIHDEDTDDRPRPRMTTSNSGAEIMLGLETDDGKSAEVEIDSLESDELQPEEIPKGRVRKTSIVEKLSKSKESELIALSILENAGQRQREFEKLINEHQELVQEISRTPSAENIVQSEVGRDP